MDTNGVNHINDINTFDSQNSSYSIKPIWVECLSSFMLVTVSGDGLDMHIYLLTSQFNFWAMFNQLNLNELMK